MEHQQTQCNDEVLDRNLLVGLAILAQANGRSVIEEMNIALSSYVMECLPQKLDEKDSTSAYARSYTGLRLAEVTALKWRDVDLTTGKLMVRQGKGSKDRTLCG